MYMSTPRLNNQPFALFNPGVVFRGKHACDCGAVYVQNLRKKSSVGSYQFHNYCCIYMLFLYYFISHYVRVANEKKREYRGKDAYV